jgi:superfamily II DNA/RNA helicase
MVDQPGLIIGTPGRIKEIIEKEWLSLSSINTVIIDEADKFC